MLEIGRHLDFGQEALDAKYGTEFGLEDLECDLAVVLEVTREIDRGHPAFADEAIDDVSPGKGGIELLSDVHGEKYASPVRRVQQLVHASGAAWGMRRSAGWRSSTAVDVCNAMPGSVYILGRELGGGGMSRAFVAAARPSWFAMT